jgi:hypothetical protein
VTVDLSGKADTDEVQRDGFGVRYRGVRARGDAQGA